MKDSNDINKIDVPRSEDYYNMYSSRDFYRGTSFKMAGEWKENTYYFNDVHIIDFVSYKGALLYCLRSHISSEANIPKLIFDHDIVVGVKQNQYWAFVLGNSGKGEKGDIGPKGDPGAPGITPKLRIENGRWMLSIDDGKTWTDEGQATGANGRDGAGVISGGTIGQVLAKRSNADYDTEWKTISEGGGEIPNLSATVVNTQESPTAEAAVVLEEETFKFSFKLPRGKDGINGTPGTDGIDGQDGLSIKMMYAKSSSDSIMPVVVKDNVNPGSIWSPVVPIHLNSEFIWSITANFRNTNLIGEWSDPLLMTGIPGTEGPQGTPGPAGNPGPAGKDGVSGIPGISIEIKYCIGTETTYTGSTILGNIRNPEGWSNTVPTITKDNPYIWFIQSRITYRDNNDNIGNVEGTWSTPSILSGINGLDGAPGMPGSKGQIVYPEGIYDSNATYICDENKAPYVYDSVDANYYLLNKVTTWVGTDHPGVTPYSDTSGSWLKIDAAEAIFTKILLAGTALIGSSVFKDDWMFSQQGIDQQGNISTNYENFDPDDASNSSFIPNTCVNFNTGKASFASGSVVFDKGLMLFGNIITGVRNPFNRTFGVIKSEYTTAKDYDNDTVVDSINTIISLDDLEIRSWAQGGASSDGYDYGSDIEMTGYPATGDNSILTIHCGGGSPDDVSYIKIHNKTTGNYVAVNTKRIIFGDNTEEVSLRLEDVKKLLALIN